MLLDTPESVHQALEEFDLTRSDIDAFFTAHEVSPTGIVHYSALMARAALSDGTRDPTTALMALVASGVALGLQLADKHRELADDIGPHHPYGIAAHREACAKAKHHAQHLRVLGPDDEGAA